MSTTSYATLLQLRLEAARRLGCEVVPLDPETGFLYELRRGQQTRLIHGGLSPLNDAVAARIASDKYHTGLVLEAAGFKAVTSARCLKPGHFTSSEFDQHTGLAPARAFVAKHGYPVVVKPNRGSRGHAIEVVDDEPSMSAAINYVWQRDYLALVQVPVPGIDLRLDLLDGEFLFAYVRRPVEIVGDGTSNVRQLLGNLDLRFSGDSFEQHLVTDAIWLQASGAAGWTLETTPDHGDRLQLGTPILNLNRMCVAERLESAPEPWMDAARRISHRMHLRHIGIDFKIQDLSQDPTDATVIEVNASPSLAHMSRMGFLEQALAAETRVVEAMLQK